MTIRNEPGTSNPAPSRFTKTDEKNDDRVSLAPLGFEEAVSTLLASPPAAKG